MIIEVDFDSLFELEMTADQYTLAYLLYKQDYHNFNRFISLLDTEDIKVNLHMLELNRYISNLNLNGDLEPSKLLVRNKLKTIFDTEKDEFEELLELYPVKVLRPDGTKDYLRTDLKRCKKLYQKILGASKFRHARVMEALKFELEVRENEGSMRYMKRFPKWLASEEWKVFEERLNDKDDSNEHSGYGTTLL